MKVINVIDANEPYEAEIETYVRAGVLHHRIKFLTESQLDVKNMRESVDYDDEPRGNFSDED